MHAPIKYAEKALSLTANAVWAVMQWGYRLNQNPSFTPKWSDEPILKSWEKTKPTLGWPRETDSLCPVCTRELRQEIVDGKKDVSVLLTEKIGEIKATIVERDGKVLMVKDCPKHGHFEDVLSIDPAFTRHIEEMFQGRDIRAHADAQMHKHGSSTILHGRGAVLTVDLTNRCNMMCDPCFTDANQVGFVHELNWEQIKTILDNAASIKPRRQMSVQFSGGEPTLSPHFLDAVRYARKLGYNSVQAATNGIEFAKSPEFCRQAAEAGLRYVYLQFDGVGNAPNSHRHVGNLFDVKLQAIENLHTGRRGHRARRDDHQRREQRAGGADHRVRHRQPEEAVVPLVPAGVLHGARRGGVRRAAGGAALHAGAPGARREEAAGVWRAGARLVPDLDDQHVCRVVRHHEGPERGVRPAWVRLPPGLRRRDGADDRQGDVGRRAGAGVPQRRTAHEGHRAHQRRQPQQEVGGHRRGGLALLRNYNSFGAPPRFKLKDLCEKFDKAFGATKKDYGKVTGDRTLADIEKRRSDKWAFIFVAGMWFQDLWTYDFRRTEMCIIPYGTEEGEISFCAYNTGIGWRQIIEKKHMQSTVADWYAKKGRHRDLRRQPLRAAHRAASHAQGESGRGGRRRPDGPRRQGRGQDGSRRKAEGAQAGRRGPGREGRGVAGRTVGSRQ